MAKIRDVFAQNLRNALSGRGAIARLSEGTGISPVQLNRYLKGTIPNEPNLKLITAWLKIEEHTLFQDNNMIEGAKFRGFVRSALQSSTTQFKENLRHYGSTIFYFQIPGTQSHVIQSVALLYQENNQTLFHRYTKLQAGQPSASSNLSSVHYGIVSRVGDSEYYTGFCRDEPHEPTFIAINMSEKVQQLWIGESLIRTLSGPQRLRVVAERNVSVRTVQQAENMAGVHSVAALKRAASIRHLLFSTEPPEVALIT